MIFDCPGSQKFKQPQPEEIRCEHCGGKAEIWTDEFQAACPHCKKAIYRKAGNTCLDWCVKAKECVGEEMYDMYMDSKKLKERRRGK